MSNLRHRLARSCQLLVVTFRVIAHNKKLMLFPLITAFFTLLMALFFVLPVTLIPTGFSWASLDHWQAVIDHVGELTPWVGPLPHPVETYLWLAGLYLVSMFCATFFQVALYSEVMHALAGEKVSIRGGLGFACSRVRSILIWSLFAGVVGLAIRTLEARFGWAGRLVLRFVGVLWSVAAVFAIPVMVRERSANPLALLRASAATFRKTWGESLTGSLSLGFGSSLVLLCAGALLLLAVALVLTLNSLVLMGGLIAVWLLAMIGFSWVTSLAGHVYRCALYVYATEGVVPVPFSEEQMHAAWKVRGGGAS